MEEGMYPLNEEMTTNDYEHITLGVASSASSNTLKVGHMAFL